MHYKDQFLGCGIDVILTRRVDLYARENTHPVGGTFSVDRTFFMNNKNADKRNQTHVFILSYFIPSQKTLNVSLISYFYYSKKWLNINIDQHLN